MPGLRGELSWALFIVHYINGKCAEVSGLRMNIGCLQLADKGFIAVVMRFYISENVSECSANIWPYIFKTVVAKLKMCWFSSLCVFDLWSLRNCPLVCSRNIMKYLDENIEELTLRVRLVEFLQLAHRAGSCHLMSHHGWRWEEGWRPSPNAPTFRPSVRIRFLLAQQFALDYLRYLRPQVTTAKATVSFSIIHG